jgi:hypothetical protein
MSDATEDIEVRIWKKGEGAFRHFARNDLTGDQLEETGPGEDQRQWRVWFARNARSLHT